MRTFSLPRGRSSLAVFVSSLLALLSAGCASEQRARYESARLELHRAHVHLDEQRAEDPFRDRAVLERGPLVEAVLARNPSIDAARHAWRAALAEVPQATSLDDPRVSVGVAPLTFAPPTPTFGGTARVEQRFPFPGKLSLRGAALLAEAEAARGDLEAVRLELALMTSLLFYDLYELSEALVINDEHIALLEQLQESAKGQFAAGRAGLEDPVQAEVERAHLEHRRVVLESRRDVVRAQLNALLRRPSRATLPPPPDALPRRVALDVDDARMLEVALEARPELSAAKARIDAAEDAVALARLAYWPDVGVEGQLNTMWPMPQHWVMVGASVNVPVWLGRRAAGVDEAEARLARARSEHAGKALDVDEEVESARRRLEEARHVVRLHEERLVPSAKAQLEAALATFTSGKGSFLSVIEAERNVRSTALGIEEATADLHRQAARLERALGRVPVTEEKRDEP